MKTKFSHSSVFITVFLCSLILLNLMVTYQKSKPINIEVTGNIATIRLPGEYKGELIVRYNKKYLEQAKQEISDNVLTIRFNKPGYYDCKINGQRYIFKVCDSTDVHFDVDLLQEELRTIELYNKMACLIDTLIISMAEVLLILIFFVIYNRCKRKRNQTKKDDLGVE